jgi:hypothetical protein
LPSQFPSKFFLNVFLCIFHLVILRPIPTRRTISLVTYLPLVHYYILSVVNRTAQSICDQRDPCSFLKAKPYGISAKRGNFKNTTGDAECASNNNFSYANNIPPNAFSIGIDVFRLIIDHDHQNRHRCAGKEHLLLD